MNLQKYAKYFTKYCSVAATLGCHMITVRVLSYAWSLISAALNENPEVKP